MVLETATLLLALAQTAPLVEVRTPTVLHIVAPDSVEPELRDRIRADAKWTLQPYTILTVVAPEASSLDPAKLDRCVEDGRLMCWVLAARPDYAAREEELLSTTYRAYRNALEARKETYVRYLTVATLRPRTASSPERIGVLFLDTDRSLEIYHSIDREQPDWRERVENLLYGEAAHTEEAVLAFDDDQGIRELFDRVWRNRQQVFHSRGEWFPNGQVRISMPRPGLLIALDGWQLKATNAERVTFDGVVAGTHVVQVTDPEGRFNPWVHTFQIREAQQIDLSATLDRNTLVETQVRNVVTWAGVGLAAVGTTIAIVGATSGGEVRELRVCGADCLPSGRRFKTFGDLSTPSGVFPEEPGGLMVTPVGYGLATTGLSWTLGTLFVGEHWEYPWMQILLGVGLGAATYGLTNALQ